MNHYYKKLNIWTESIEVVMSIYEITKSFPDDEKFGLVSQMRRAGISVTSNIAEGSSRQTVKHFNHFLTLALGSINELQSQLIISQKLNYVSTDDQIKLEQELTKLNNMIFAFSKKILDQKN